MKWFPALVLFVLAVAYAQTEFMVACQGGGMPDQGVGLG